MLENEVIKEANSSYSSNIIVIEKKDGKEKGMDCPCVNLAPFNKITISDKYLLPNIDEMLTNFHEAIIFTNAIGLNNILAIFQKLLNKILRKYLYKFCIIYLDDIIIYSKNIKEHRKHIRLVLQVIKEAG